MLFENLLCFLRNQKEHNINEIIQRALDLLGQIAARVLGTRVSATINKFNSGKRIRSYFQTIYSWFTAGTGDNIPFGIMGTAI
jgi:hypothetical protein